MNRTGWKALYRRLDLAVQCLYAPSEVQRYRSGAGLALLQLAFSSWTAWAMGSTHSILWPGFVTLAAVVAALTVIVSLMRKSARIFLCALAAMVVSCPAAHCHLLTNLAPRIVHWTGLACLPPAAVAALLRWRAVYGLSLFALLIASMLT